MLILLWSILYTQTLIIEDRILYKIKNEVIFESDLPKIINKYRIYRCHLPQSALFSSNFKNRFFEILGANQKSKFTKQQILDLLKLEKLLVYAKSQEIPITLSNFKKKKECKEVLQDEDLKNLMRFEQLLISRFSKKGELLSESIQSLIDTIDHQYAHELYF